MPFFDGLEFRCVKSSAWLSTRHTLDGLTAPDEIHDLSHVSCGTQTPVRENAFSISN